MTTIQYLNDLRQDFERLTEAETDQRSSVPASRVLRQRRFGVGAAVVCIVVAAGLVGISMIHNRGATRAGSSGLGGSVLTGPIENGMSMAPFGSDPFFGRGKDVSARQAAAILAATTRHGAGPLVEPNSPAANPSNRIHIWVGPSGQRQKAFVFEYKSGISVEVDSSYPLTLSPAQIRAGFASEIAQWGPRVARLETIDGVPAMVLHGNGSTIILPHGTESVNGTTIQLDLNQNRLTINIWATHTVPEADVIAAANSLATLNPDE